MKTEKYDWLLKLSYVTGDGDYRVSYVNSLGYTKEELMCLVDEYRKNHVVVHVYKLQKI